MNSTSTPLTLAVVIRDAVHTIHCEATRENREIFLRDCCLVWRDSERPFDVHSLREVNCTAVYEAAREAFNA